MSDVEVFVNRMAWEGDAATALFFKLAEPIVQAIIVETIEEVSTIAGDEGFPPEYSSHLIEQVIISSPTRTGPDGITVDFTLLGTYEHYAMGFHRHAISDDNQRIELPYANQPLKNDIDVRQTFWEDKVAGTFLYEDTIQNRVEVWASLGVAPEWWVLQNGSDSDPYVTPRPLAEIVSRKLEGPLAALYEETMQMAVDRADHGWATTPTGGLRYNVRGAKGQFVKR